MFEAMGTQWRIGPGGPVGLDYGVFPTVLRLEQVPRAEWQEAFSMLRVMEAEALIEMRKEPPKPA